MALTLSMTPYQRFKTIFGKWLRLASTPIGLNILDEDFKFSLKLLFSTLMTISMVIFSFYTMFAFDTEMFFKAFACISLTAQACVKLYTVVTSRSDIVFMSSYVENIYVVNEKKPSKKIRDIMDECSLHNLFITATLYSLYLISGIIFLLYPVLVFAIFQIKEPWLPIFIPRVDYNTKEGFVITSIYHYVVIYLAAVGIGFVDALFSNLVFNVLTMSKLQCNQLSMMNDELMAGKPCARKIRARLINLCTMNLEMEKYIELINATYFWMIFVQIVTNSCCLVLIVYVITTMTWYPAYFLAISLAFQLFLFCALGTVIEVANDKLEFEHLQASFYLLPLDLQRDYHLVVSILQRRSYLKAAQTSLNVNVFVSIMRKIYGFIMCLRTAL